MREHSPETIHHGEDVLRVAAAQIADDHEAIRLVLARYIPEGLDEFPDVEQFLMASLAVVASLVIDLAKITSVTPEALIDELLLELV